MAITNASRLADFGSGIGTEGAVIQVDNTNKRVGIGTTNPLGMLQVGTGITMYTTGIGSFNSDLYVGGNLNVTGDLTYDEVTGVNINISGVGTIGTLGVSVATTSKDLLVTGVSTIGTLGVSVATTSKDLLVTGVSTFTGVVDSNDTTQSSSSTTGAAKFAGGVGVAKNLFVGGGAEVTGITTITGDVSIADKIIHTGDTDTAIRFPDADTITAETGGSERLRVDSSGKVGIGTVNPEDLLHLWSGHSGASSVGAAQLILESSGSANWIHFKNPNTQNAGLLWSDADATEKAVIMYNHNTDNMEIKGDDDLIFKTDNTLRLTIDASGNSGFTGIVTATKFDGPGNVPAGQTGTVTLAASDAGKHVAATGTVTLGTGIFAVGDAVTIYNNSGGNITINVSAVTCYNAADASTSNRTLAQRGLATILCTAANTYVISGAGLS